MASKFSRKLSLANQRAIVTDPRPAAIVAAQYGVHINTVYSLRLRYSTPAQRKAARREAILHRHRRGPQSVTADHVPIAFDERETQIIQLAEQGLNQTQIGVKLGLSQSVVSRAIRRIRAADPLAFLTPGAQAVPSEEPADAAQPTSAKTSAKPKERTEGEWFTGIDFPHKTMARALRYKDAIALWRAGFLSKKPPHRAKWEGLNWHIIEVVPVETKDSSNK